MSEPGSGTAPMLQTSVEQSGAEWVVLANLDGETRVLSSHPDERAARNAERSVREAAERSAAASGDDAG